MKRQGQITLFVIIGILVVFVISITLLVRETSTKRELTTEIERGVLPSDVMPIQNYMDACLGDALAPAIFLLGIQGGYINPPDDALLTTHSVVAYGAIDGRSVLPRREEIQRELEAYLEESIKVCSASLVVFEDQGFKIERKEAKATVSIAQDAVLALVEYPHEVAYLDLIYTIEKFFASVPIRLGFVLDELDLIVKTVTKSPEYVDYNGLSQRGGHVSVMPYDEQTILYSFQDKNSTIDDAPFTFMFAVRDETVNTAPELLFIENMVMTKGDPFTYEVIAMDAENDRLTFSTDNPSFPIDVDTGSLNVTPPQVGIYQVVFGVRDTHGLTDEQSVRIEIVERSEEEAAR